MSQRESNPNYGTIALVTGDYSVDNFGEKRSVTGRLVAIENDVRLFTCNSAKGRKQREQYRFRHYEEGESCTIAAFCLATDAIVIDENDLETSLSEAWINGFHRKTLLQKATYPFKPKLEQSLERLMKEYEIMSDVRDSFVDINSPAQ